VITHAACTIFGIAFQTATCIVVCGEGNFPGIRRMLPPIGAGPLIQIRLTRGIETL
jgi:hypothetical protein